MTSTQNTPEPDYAPKIGQLVTYKGVAVGFVYRVDGALCYYSIDGKTPAQHDIDHCINSNICIWQFKGKLNPLFKWGSTNP